MQKALLPEIENFIAEFGVGPTYFGKAAVRNQKLVERLRAGGKVWPHTEAAVRLFIRTERAKRTEAADPIASHETSRTPLPKTRGSNSGVAL